MKRFLTLTVVLLWTTTSGAQSLPKRLWHGAGHHKELIASITLTGVALGLDAASSVHCQHVNPGCVETSPLLPRHPSELQTWGTAAGFEAAMGTANWAIWHFAPTHGDRHLIWFVDAPLVTVETQNIWGNYDAASVGLVRGCRPRNFYLTNFEECRKF